MIRCVSYKTSDVPGMPKALHIAFRVEDDMSPEFYVPKDILSILVRAAFQTGRPRMT